MPSNTPPAPRVQPPPPKISPPSATTYRSQRQEELDAIRRRGLAKIFNKHFTTVADKIRQEHEAAELALAEIVKRKEELAANPKSFDGAGGLTLTQLDKLHMEIMKRKKEVQRKERETQELYKRYCSQYEDNEHVARHIRLQEGLGDDMSLVRQTDLMLAKALDKGQATQNADVSKLANLLEEGANLDDEELRALTPDKIWTRPSEENDENDGNGANSTPAGSIPLAKKLSFTPDAIAPSAEMTPSKKFLTQASPATTQLSTPQSDTAAKTPGSKGTPAANATLRVTALGCDSSVMDQSLYMNADDESEVSGLTDIDGATVAEAEWKLTEFLRNETENIKKMFSAEGEEEETESSGNNSYSQSVFSHLGGLTFVSGESDRVGRAAKKAEEMVKQMAEATAWMNDPTLLDSDSDSDSGSVDAKPKPDWCAFWSADHNREYYFNRFTNQTCWTKPQGVEIDFSQTKNMQSDDMSVTSTGTSVSIVLSNPDLPEEKVTVKDYTKSTRSNTSAVTSTSSDSYSNDDLVKVYRPDTASATDGSVNSRGSVNKPSKVLQYRRKRAQQRKKKRLIAALVITSAIGGVVYTQRETLFPRASVDVPPVEEIIIPASNNFDLTSAAKKLDEVRLAKEEEQKRLVLEAAKKAKLIAAKKKEEEQRKLEQKKKDEEMRKKAEAEALKKKKLDEQKRKEAKEAEKKAEEERIRKKEAERKKREEELLTQELALKEEQARRENEIALWALEMHRPWGCNVPFTYLMSKKCWRVASKNPIYDTEDITNNMME